MSILLSLPCVAAAAAAAGSARISHLHPPHSDRRRHRLRIKATTGCWIHIHYDEQTQSTDAVCSLVWLTDHLLPATRLISPPVGQSTGLGLTFHRRPTARILCKKNFRSRFYYCLRTKKVDSYSAAGRKIFLCSSNFRNSTDRVAAIVSAP